MSVFGICYSTSKHLESVCGLPWALTPISLPVRDQRRRPAEDVWTCSQWRHGRGSAKCHDKARLTAASARCSGWVCGQEEKCEKIQGRTEEWIKASKCLYTSRKQQPYRLVEGGRDEKRWPNRLERSVPMFTFCLSCSFFSHVLLSSILLSLRHPQPLLRLQPALPPGIGHREKLLLWRQASLLHPSSRSRPAEFPVQPLLPRQGDHPKASGAATGKVIKTNTSCIKLCFFTHASNVALLSTTSVCHLACSLPLASLKYVNKVEWTCMVLRWWISLVSSSACLVSVFSFGLNAILDKRVPQNNSWHFNLHLKLNESITLL